ncbi:C2 domain-containing protein 5-like isoform X5 [Dreissena polymorpha]|uniref:C2 domain-containing protein 5-like isoform X5 n=1 Tax=Dreissena polymorpha TaxID=45954 RepID=UPI002263B613|nr:C2 domain-containing protein 5-like isoform X5 [Dreissena polymorpha]
MPGTLKVKIVAARDLPVMDRSTDLTDAFVEIKMGTELQKTEVFKRSLYPQWNSDWFKFEVEDEVLQDEPLELRVLDHDTYSAHDAIGKVYIDLNPLLVKESPSVISGWFPVYDTMHGIRGDLNVIVKIDLFSDFNKFRQSSCGIQFFCTAEVPAGYRLQYVHGFVEELVVNDDPEYQWIDKIRTPRSSNEARQRLFSKMSGQLTRKIGLKVLEMGGGAVIGFKQCFDLEGESGIVIRGIGTAVTLAKARDPPVSPLGMSPLKDSPVPEESNAPSSPQSKNELSSTSPMKMNGTGTRHSSGSDASTPPKGNFLDCSSGSGSGKNFPKICSQQINIELMEFPLFTMTSFPPGFILHLGGVVAARSVKLLDKIHNPEEPETRDAWWNEIRTEIRSHTRAMGCHAVIGYSEETSICDDIILLSAMGTAAKVNLNLDQYQSTRLAPPQVVNTGDRSNMSAERDQSKKLYVDVNLANQVSHRLGLDESSPRYNCALCHIPYKPSSSPFPINLTQCACCRRRYVPDLLFTTINRPPEIHTVGHGAFIQARVCRPKGDGKTEVNAKEISDILPFMEYELHNQLVVKLKIRSMNCLFGLKMQFVVGESMLIGIATGTGVFLSPLPAPPVPRLVGQVTSEEENVELQELQLQIQEKLQRHKDLYNLNSVKTLGRKFSRQEISNQNLTSGVQTDDSDDDTSDLDLSAGNKDTFILEVDDTKDNSVKAMLSDVLQPPGMYVCNTDTYPGLTSQNLASNLQMFTQVFRRTVDNLQGLNKDFSEFFDSVFRRLFFKLRRMIPCCLCNVSFAVGAPEENQIEIVVTGICVRVDDSTSQNNSLTDNPMPMHGLETPMTGASSKSLLKPVSNVVGASGENVDEMMFPMEEVTEGSGASANKAARLKVVSNSRNTSQVFSRTFHGIEVTPLAYVPGARIERYIGSYNFFFIRETSSVKEVGGVCGFMQKFITEVLAIVRAHVSSLGGNALVAYNMTQCVLLSNEHKNQSQCLINVCGDAVFASREGEITAVVPDLIHSRKPSDSPSFAT